MLVPFGLLTYYPNFDNFISLEMIGSLDHTKTFQRIVYGLKVFYTPRALF